jgi:hypothetical protein
MADYTKNGDLASESCLVKPAAGLGRRLVGLFMDHAFGSNYVTVPHCKPAICLPLQMCPSPSGKSKTIVCAIKRQKASFGMRLTLLTHTTPNLPAYFRHALLPIF